MSERQSKQAPTVLPSGGSWDGGSWDGEGAGDHDHPYRFGYRPTHRWTYPFDKWQLCHLLVLRGRILDGEYADDRAR